MDKKFLKLHQIIGEDGLLPISKTRWYAGIKSGLFPRPIKIGRASLWDASEVNQAIERLKNENREHSFCVSQNPSKSLPIKKS